jgi:anti-sigma B factor antagonist
MVITSKSIGNCRVLSLNGRIVYGDNTDALRNAIQEAIQQNSRKIVLNLSNVSFMDSLGLGELIRSYNYAKEHGGKLVLTNLHSRIKYQLTIVKLNTVIENFDTEDMALASA